MIRDQLATLPFPDWGQVAEEAVKVAPGTSSLVLRGVLFLFAPHFRRLGLTLRTWDKRSCEGEFKASSSWLPWRQVAGATEFAQAGELVANLVLLRNLNPIRYSFKLKELNVVADQDPAACVKVSCTLDPQSFSKLRIELGAKKETTITLKSELTNPSGISVAQVRSAWLIKKR